MYQPCTSRDPKVEKDLVLSEEGTAFAYYPYNSKVTDGTVVPLEIESQTDYLYATPAVVDEKNPIAQIGMKHALSLISVRIRKNDYQHAGKSSLKLKRSMSSKMVP